MKSGGAIERWVTKLVAKPLVFGVSKLLLAIDALRKTHQRLYELILIVLVSYPAYYLWKAYGPHLPGDQADHTLYQIFHFLAIGGVAFVFGVVLKAVLPWFLYLPYAAEMRALGLLRISTDNGSTLRLVNAYIGGHDVSTPVKIICISGKHLFREPRGEDRDAPFNALAHQGKLDVVMPIASPTNPTILSRHESYDDGFRTAAYPKLGDLVNEVQISQDFLRGLKNTVTSHDILCFWRVVIFSHVCLVQNYFPNTDGRDSDWAPTFVFENGAESSYSYYKTFSTMFNLVKRHNRIPPAAPSPQDVPSHSTP